ncbi:hypothetical protein CC1G_11364 [Coprinopsis cinerea okayama7|uniref:DUF7137 domain-containing protein n=1 Tax=Coprinopsis cinerea (strain Okayama-7 / 130 / ATCC MYA-4618 / FGSC 9003) TaxID=240176 RepID=A8P8X0_COPC7|nr:hypothetical protein CC1G_11364 [Coprinopsis cinerea okayama7\|eukprot:XP_001839653.1 hypothetical protein CC1G_11364 [Coprinopsis cinerea okayama7\
MNVQNSRAATVAVDCRLYDRILDRARRDVNLKAWHVQRPRQPATNPPFQFYLRSRPANSPTHSEIPNQYTMAHELDPEPSFKFEPSEDDAEFEYHYEETTISQTDPTRTLLFRVPNEDSFADEQYFDTIQRHLERRGLDFDKDRRQNANQPSAGGNEPAPSPSPAASLTSVASATAEPSSGTSEGDGSSRGSATSGSSASRSASSTSHISIPITAPAGAIVMTQPPQTVGTSFFKISPSGPNGPNLVTFGWNMTNVIVQPTSLTVQAACQNGFTYAVGGPMGNSTASDPADQAAYTGEGVIPASQSRVIWDVIGYQEAHPETPLPQGLCTLRINDERGFGAAHKAGYLAPNDGLTFALYTGEAYTPLASGWSCPACIANGSGRLVPYAIPVLRLAAAISPSMMPELEIIFAVLATLVVFAGSMIYILKPARRNSASASPSPSTTRQRRQKFFEAQTARRRELEGTGNVPVGTPPNMDTALPTPTLTNRSLIIIDPDDTVEDALKVGSVYKAMSRGIETFDGDYDGDEDDRDAEEVENELLMLWDGTRDSLGGRVTTVVPFGA